jgi:hypothetical protein
MSTTLEQGVREIPPLVTEHRRTDLTTAAPATGLLLFKSSTLLLTPKGEQEYELMKLSISYPKDTLKG